MYLLRLIAHYSPSTQTPLTTNQTTTRTAPHWDLSTLEIQEALETTTKGIEHCLSIFNYLTRGVHLYLRLLSSVRILSSKRAHNIRSLFFLFKLHRSSRQHSIKLLFLLLVTGVEELIHYFVAVSAVWTVRRDREQIRAFARSRAVGRVTCGRLGGRIQEVDFARSRAIAHCCTSRRLGGRRDLSTACGTWCTNWGRDLIAVGHLAGSRTCFPGGELGRRSRSTDGGLHWSLLGGRGCHFAWSLLPHGSGSGLGVFLTLPGAR